MCLCDITEYQTILNTKPGLVKQSNEFLEINWNRICFLLKRGMKTEP